MLLTFTLLALAICSVWMPSVRLGAALRVTPWMVLFVASIIASLANRLITPIGVAVLLVFSVVAYLAARKGASRAQKIGFGTLTALLSVALAMHRLPGFLNPVIVANAHFTPDAAAFTQYANFDKGAAGLILLALFCQRCSTLDQLRQTFRIAIPAALLTCTVVFGIALAADFVRIDSKWPSYTPTFLIINLFFAVAAEEAFFRGFLQSALSRCLDRFKNGGSVAVALSGGLFGVAHLAGGPVYATFATVAGLGYAISWQLSKRIEAALLVHFLLNSVHFVLFTYPFVAH